MLKDQFVRIPGVTPFSLDADRPRFDCYISGTNNEFVFAAALVCTSIIPIDSTVAKLALLKYYPEDVALTIALAPVLFSKESEKKWKIKSPTTCFSNQAGCCIAALVPLSTETEIRLLDQTISNEVIVMDSSLEFSFIGIVKVVLLASHTNPKMGKAWEKALMTGFVEKSIIPCDALQPELLVACGELEKLRKSIPLFKSKEFFVPTMFGVSSTAIEKHQDELQACIQQISRYPALLQKYCKPQLDSCKAQTDRDLLRRSLTKLKNKIGDMEGILPNWQAVERKFIDLENEFKELPLQGVYSIEVKKAKIHAILNKFPSSLDHHLKEDLERLELGICELKDVIEDQKQKPKKQDNKRQLETSTYNDALMLYHSLKVEGLERNSEVRYFEELFLQAKEIYVGKNVKSFKEIEFLRVMEDMKEFMEEMRPFILQGKELAMRVNQMHQVYKETRLGHHSVDAHFEVAKAAKGKFCIYTLKVKVERCHFIFPVIDPEKIDLTNNSPMSPSERIDFVKKNKDCFARDDWQKIRDMLDANNWSLVRAYETKMNELNK